MKLKLLFLSLFISFIGYSQTISVSGTISTNTTWSVDTVKVTGNVLVNDLVTLTINPATYIEFQGLYSIDVSGRIVSVGTIADTIVFSINDTTDFSNTSTFSGGWNSIAINSLSATNDTSIFEYCKMMYSKGVAINAVNCNIRAEHNLFCNNYYALISSTSGNPIIKYNYLRNNRTAALRVSNFSTPIISYNSFFNNYQGIYATNSSPQISYNTISNSTTQGLSVHHLQVGSLINDNQITYNQIEYKYSLIQILLFQII